MKELNITPEEFFSNGESTLININGTPARVMQTSDEYGNYFAIEAINKDVSDICGTFLFDKYIHKIDYAKYQNKIVIIKAYFN